MIIARKDKAVPVDKQYELKALLGGSVAIVVLGLVTQLIYIFIAVAYVEVLKLYPELEAVGEPLSKVMFWLVFVLVMVFGGYLTADIAGGSPLLHGALVGGITTIGSLMTSLGAGELTQGGIAFVVGGLICATFGGYYWQRRQA